MKRGALVALLALLAMIVASGTTAVATSGTGPTAQASKKGKKKGCKKKGKAKSRTSAAASTKKKGCKSKGKTTGKAPQGTPKTEGAAPQPAAPGASWPPADGVYTDVGGSGFTLKLSGNASSASIMTGATGAYCVLGYISPSQPATTTATTLTSGGEQQFTSVGSNFTVKWNITVTSDLGYTLTVDSKNEGGPVPPCDKPGVVVKGTLAKIG